MSCCVSGFVRAPQYEQAAMEIAPAPQAIRDELASALVPLAGGFFDMGARQSLYPGDFDSPRRKVKLSPFAIAPTSVTNAQFARFVQATGYRTLAEGEGWSFVFHLFLAEPARHPDSPDGLPWWRIVEGASWACPEGPQSTLRGAKITRPASISAGMTRWPIAAGRAWRCPPRHSGNTPRAAVWRTRNSPGATRSSPRAALP